MKRGKHGGAGGGIIWLTTPRSLTIKDSVIKVNGMSADVLELDEAGSGGGSAGSIQLQMQNLKGDGLFELKGGDGSRNGGGGGSGGRLAINFLEPYMSRSQPQQSFYWSGTYNITGGKAGVPAHPDNTPARDGDKGTVFASKCYPGYEGEFCKPCPLGWFKYGYSYGSCQPCLNKPPNSHYT